MDRDTNERRREAGRAGFSSEYVELKTELRDLAGVFKADLAKVLAKLESLEHYIRDIQRETARLENQVQSNREAIGALKGAASLLGAVAGTAVSLVVRFLGGHSGS